MKHFTYTEEQVQKLANYLAMRPYAEVEKVIQIIRSPVKIDDPSQETVNGLNGKKEDPKN